MVPYSTLWSYTLVPYNPLTPLTQPGPTHHTMTVHVGGCALRYTWVVSMRL